jgi:hypothetical protein
MVYPIIYKNSAMKALKIIFILVFSMMLTSTAFAEECQALPPCDEEGIPGEDCCPGANVPFDGGVSFLIAAGLSIGGYSIFKRKKTAE